MTCPCVRVDDIRLVRLVPSEHFGTVGHILTRELKDFSQRRRAVMEDEARKAEAYEEAKSIVKQRCPSSELDVASCSRCDEVRVPVLEKTLSEMQSQSLHTHHLSDKNGLRMSAETGHSNSGKLLTSR